MRMTRPCDKFDYEQLGPINELPFPLYIPSHMRLHPMLHYSFLEPYATSTNLNRVIPPPPHVQVANDPMLNML